ncbi:zinc-binding dehydrogenase [Streptomyces sp. SBR177]
MRVVEVTAYGGPEVLHMARRPEPEAGEVPGKVRVRLKAAGVTVADLRIRAGYYADELDPLRPPSSWARTSRAGCSTPRPALRAPFRPARVWRASCPGSPSGPARAPTRRSSGSTRSGWRRSRTTGLHPGGLRAAGRRDRPAGPGRPPPGPGLDPPRHRCQRRRGRFAVQFASAAGLEVVAVAHEGDESELKVLGAKHCVTRGEPAEVLTQVLAAVPDRVDGVFDGALVGSPALPAAKDGGAFVALATDRTPEAERGIRVDTVFGRPDPAELATIFQKVADRELITRVADVMPLEEAAEAHRRAEAGRRPGGSS